jgi:hypothetical protein
VHRPIDRDDYLTKAAKYFGGESTDQSAVGSAWHQRSVLEIYVNGLKTPHYTFDVVKVGTSEHRTDLGAYDAPVTDFEYTQFACKLRRLD